MLKFWFSLFFWQVPFVLTAQTQAFYVSFGSACCGIDRQGFEVLRKRIKQFEKKYTALPTWVAYWGKEGERVCYIFAPAGKEDAFEKFAAATIETFRQNTYQNILAHPLIVCSYHTLWVHCPPFGINQAREQKWLRLAESVLKTLPAAMINETHAEEQQDKRYEVSLQQRSDFIAQTKRIFSTVE